MLTVWTGAWGGKYSDYYPQRLKREVAKHLTIPHQFKCLSDHDIEGVETVSLSVDWDSWWPKLSLFSGVARGASLWLDLDVVITGSLDELVMRYMGCELAMPANWAASGHGGCQSSVMLWNGDLTFPFDHFRYEIDAPRLWGDQEYLTELRDRGLIDVTHTDEMYVKSYKYHCRQGLPENCRVVVFHGLPNPADVREEWFEW